MNIKKMMDEAERIDYRAVIARFVGEDMSAEQQEMCKRFDDLYDATHENAPSGWGE